MLQNQQNEAPSPFYIPPGTPPPSAARMHVTPEELTQALNALQARKANEGQPSVGTISIGQAVDELSLGATPEEIWQQVQAQRMSAHAVSILPAYYGSAKGRRGQIWGWPIGIGLLMLLIGWGLTNTYASSPIVTPVVVTHTSTPLHHTANVISAGQNTIINSDNGVLTYECHGGEMVLNGSNDVITIHGDCSSVTISGDNDEVTVSGSGGSTIVNGSNNSLKENSADSLVASGDNNTITMPNASGMTITNNGSNNSIHAGSNTFDSDGNTTITVGQ